MLKSASYLTAIQLTSGSVSHRHTHDHNGLGNYQVESSMSWAMTRRPKIQRWQLVSNEGRVRKESKVERDGRDGKAFSSEITYLGTGCLAQRPQSNTGWEKVR